MDSVVRGLVTYVAVWIVFRIAGKRTLAQITTFDAVLLLIISETTQAALLGNDNSITNTVLLVLTLLGTDVLLSEVKRWWPAAEKVLDGCPLVLIDRGRLDKHAMHVERVDEEDVLAAARVLQGLGRLDEIEYAVLEQSGGITVIPKRKTAGS
ncbi:MAG: DUF421 domain-containing protein [Pirellulales bacterium]|nr:DUF421 domain-containing protein [Pirellulales bacterium]